jgi:hypothetical protein
LLAFATLSFFAVIANAFPYGPYSAFTGDFGKVKNALLVNVNAKRIMI